METTLTCMEPIPVEYILGIAQSKATPAQRRPYIELIERWGDEMNRANEARQLLKRLRDGQVLDPMKMPREFMPRYRQPEVAEKLIEIVRKIDAIIASKQENWTWAHVMRVMTDEGILYKPTINRFDQFICAMVPDRGATPFASMATTTTSWGRTSRGRLGPNSPTSTPPLLPSAPSATRLPLSSPLSSRAPSARKSNVIPQETAEKTPRFSITFPTFSEVPPNSFPTYGKRAESLAIPYFYI